MGPICVLEAFNFRICSVCTTSGANLFYDIHQNVVSFRSQYFSLSQIIQHTLNLQLDERIQQPREVCERCKQKIVEFFVFKKTNEEARRIFMESTAVDSSQKQLLLLCKQNDEQLAADPEEEEGTDAEVFCDGIDCGLSYDELQEEGEMEEVNVTVLDTVDSHESILEITTSQSIDKDGNIAIATRREFSEKWKRNRRKLAKNSGQPYVSSKGKLVDAKEMKKGCGSCRLGCTSNLSEEQRLMNFKYFYGLADIRRQRTFLCEHMRSFEPKRSCSPTKGSKTRKVQRNFYLEVRSADGKVTLTQVCKRMFLNTLAISSQMIDTLQRKLVLGQGKIDDQRGKYARRKLNK